MALNSNIANIIERERTKKFKSKVEFTAAANIDESTYRKIGKGKQNITIKMLIKICSVLDITPSEVLKEVGY